MNAAPLLDHDRLNDIVETIQAKLAQPEIRALNNRAVQAKIWQIPSVSSMMTELRQEEEVIREKIMAKMSDLVHAFHEHSIDVTLARAGVLNDDRVHAGSSLDHSQRCKAAITAEEFDLFCLDSKERLYLILNEYDWMKDFFRFHPQHFYENSFQFVHRIPPKKLPVKVKVIGMGIGGSLAVSGLKKRGIEHVIGYDKRARNGPRSVTSRFQNASWRAYDIAETMLDEEAFHHLAEYQQRIHVNLDDGTSKVLTTDRVQIILGDAIHSALESAERYGAQLRFDCDAIQASEISNGEADTDITAFFTGAHTSELVPGLKEQMHVYSWEELNSPCKLWLEIKLSEKREAFTTRDIEVGAEKWHFSIESARNTKEDVIRIRDNIIAQHLWNMKRLEKNYDGENLEIEMEMEDKKFNEQLGKIDTLLNSLCPDHVGEHKEETGTSSDTRFDYTFTNAPDNEHNQNKLKAAYEKGDVVIEGKYDVDVKIASRSMIDTRSASGQEGDTNVKGQELLRQFNTNVIVTGGDACVQPNPMAAYGATLACEFAGMLVQLAVAHGHLNAIIDGLKIADVGEDRCNPEWSASLEELKGLFNEFYDARGRSENYFQWMQTLLCNLYSLPPMAPMAAT